MIMIHLLLKEQELINSDEPQKGRLKAVRSLRALLAQVDHASEEMPSAPDRLLRLLTSLKGKPLDEEEEKLVYEMTNNKGFPG